MINAYNMDCMELMKGKPNKYYKLSICDPPYGLDSSSTHGRGKLKNRILNSGNIQKWDIKPNKEYFDELFRVSENQIIWGGNYFHLPPSKGIIVQDKCQPWKNFSQVELAWTSFDKPAALFRYDNRTGDKIHPCQKPVALYKWILDDYANYGDNILDTHGGSFPSAIACHDLGFDLDICEIDKGYFNDGNNRLKRHQQQLSLFTPEELNESIINLEQGDFFIE